MAITTTALYTIVKNTSGVAKTFGFLPPHGRRLAANATKMVQGDIRVAVANGCGGPGGNARNLLALEKALDDGDLTIISSPSPVLCDTVTGASVILKVTSGTLGVEAPDYADSVV